MGFLDRKGTQTTVSVRMSLQEDLLRFAELLERPPSTVANDLLEAVFLAVRHGDPSRAATAAEQLLHVDGKDNHRQIGAEYYRKLAGTQRFETTRATDFAVLNTSRFVPGLKEAKRQQQSYAQAHAKLFGCLHSDLTQEIGCLYAEEIMALAAQEIYDPTTLEGAEFFQVMRHTTALYNKVYEIFLKDHLCREVVKAIPKEFQPPM